MARYDAAERIREVGRWLEAHADNIVGENNGEYIAKGGLTVSFTLESGTRCPVVKVERLHLVENEMKGTRVEVGA